MALPEKLKQAIESECAKMGLSELSQGMDQLTKSYRGTNSEKKQHMSSEVHKKAYVIYRMPATYAVNVRVLQEIEGITFSNMLDLGSGPGTAMWAVREVFPEIEKFTLVERDADLIAMSKRYVNQDGLQAVWKQQDICSVDAFEAHDLVVMSYVVNELTSDEMLKLIEKAWQATQKALVVIEPGTPAGFERIRTIRQKLIEMGGHPIAPCPHANACPMPKNDWCHFAERLERSRLHRQVKHGTLSYEDEKFSYIVMSKHRHFLPEGRILRHPQVHSGHRIFEVCSKEGLQRKTISKKDGDLYKQAKKWEWGSRM